MATVAVPQPHEPCVAIERRLRLAVWLIDLSPPIEHGRRLICSLGSVGILLPEFGQSEFSVIMSLESDEYTIGKPGQFAQLPATCPKCGSSRIVRILWDLGHRRCSRQVHDELAAGRAMLMRYRLKVGRQVPVWVCLSCEPRWEDVQRLSLQEYQSDANPDAVKWWKDSETCIVFRDAQRELRQRLIALVDDLLLSRFPNIT